MTASPDDAAPRASQAGDRGPARLGLPEEGSGSMAGWGRRLAALVVDWLGSLLVSTVLVNALGASDSAWSQWATMLVFWVEASVLTALAGASFGQRVLQLRVMTLGHRPLDLLRALLRTALICLVVPPLLTTRDGRGLHDAAVGSVVVRT